MAAGQRFYIDAPTAQVVGTDGPVVMYEASGANDAGVALWIQVFDKLQADLNPGDVPRYCYPVANLQTWAIAPMGPPTDQGRRFEVALTIAYSLTGPIYTPTGGGGGPIFASGRQLA